MSRIGDIFGSIISAIRSFFLRLTVAATTLALLAFLGWSLHVYLEIRSVAAQDNAQKADAIAVFGAAEYRGRPSPVFHARLDKALALYQRQIAPVIITLGGGQAGDDGNTEGGAGRDYLLARGVPFDHLIAETSTYDTEQQATQLAQIARDNHLHSIVVVSDATHLFRVQQLCAHAGLTVYTSPRPPLGHLDPYDSAARVLHEIVSYTSWRLRTVGSE